MIDSLPFHQLIPDRYAGYRSIVSEALERFVAGLTRVETLRADGAARGNPPDACFHLLSSCPTLHKMGQVVARDRRLDPAIRERLQRLESLAPAAPLESLQARVASLDLPGDRRFVVDGTIAEGSVATVVSARSLNTSADGPERFALKLLKPGVKSIVEEELAVSGCAPISSSCAKPSKCWTGWRETRHRTPTRTRS